MKKILADEAKLRVFLDSEEDTATGQSKSGSGLSLEVRIEEVTVDIWTWSLKTNEQKVRMSSCISTTDLVTCSFLYSRLQGPHGR